MLALRAIAQVLLRGAGVARRRDRSATEKSPRPAVLVLSWYCGANDNGASLDRLADLPPTRVRRQTGQQGGEAIGGDVGQRLRGRNENALGGRRLANAPSGAEGGKAQGDAAIGQAYDRGGAAHAPVRFGLQVEDPDPRRSHR